jgi:nicotinamidase-related amidase
MNTLPGEPRTVNGNLTLLDPDNCVLMLIDHQPQMAFAVDHIDRQLLINNVVALAKSAAVFKVPTVLTAVESRQFSGFTWSALESVLGHLKPFERTSINAWEDAAVVAAVRATGRRKVVMAGLWTECCVAFPALSALAEGHEVYAVVDCCGGSSRLAHDTAVDRMMQAGVVPITWLQFLYELQRDWARHATYDAMMQVVLQHGGGHGLGVEYAKTMLPA